MGIDGQAHIGTDDIPHAADLTGTDGFGDGGVVMARLKLNKMAAASRHCDLVRE